MALSTGPFWVFAALLVVAGWGKVMSPVATQGALLASGLPSSRAIVVVLGVAEFVAGIYAIVFGDPLGAVAVSVFYVGFAGFVVNALLRDLPVASCGCFGKEDTPPTWIHVAVTVIGLAAGVGAALAPPGSVTEVAASTEPPFLVFLLVTGIAFAFGYMSLTTLPKTLGAARRP